MGRPISSRRNAPALGTAWPQPLSPATVEELVDCSWWQPLAAASCGSHQTLHSSVAFSPAANVSTIETRAARNTGGSPHLSARLAPTRAHGSTGEVRRISGAQTCEIGNLRNFAGEWGKSGGNRRACRRPAVLACECLSITRRMCHVLVGIPVRRYLRQLVRGANDRWGISALQQARSRGRGIARHIDSSPTRPPRPDREHQSHDSPHVACS